MTFVRETYRAFWCEGKDISDPEVLSRLVEQVGGSAESMDSINGEDRRVAQEWEAACISQVRLEFPSLSRRIIISLSDARP